MMKWLIAAMLVLWAGAAQAQLGGNALVLPGGCGTANFGPGAQPQTMDSTGRTCGAATGAAAITSGTIANATISNSVGGFTTITGNASGANATATGGTTARTLGAGAADVVNVLDFGAKCDGATNDNTAIQAAVTAAAGKARVYVPNTGNPCIVTRITVPSNSHITVDGTMKLASGSGSTILAADTGSPSNIVVDGSGTLDGNMAGQTSGIQSDIYLYQASYVKISGVTLTHSYNFPLDVVASSHIWVSRIAVIDNLGSAQFAQGSFDCWLDNSEISGSTRDYGFSFYGGVYNSGVTNSRIFNNTADGISVLNDGAQPAASHDIIIANNVIYGNNANGVGIRTNSGGVGTNTTITISGNRMYGNNQQNNSQWGGVYVQTGYYVTIRGNTISGDGNGTYSSAGVNLGAAAYYVTVTGNTIYDEGYGGTNGIGILAGGNYTIITDNLIYDDQGTKTMAYALSGTTGIGSVVSGNMLGAMIGQANILTYHASSSYSQDVVAYGPRHISATIADNYVAIAQATVATLPTCNAGLKGALYGVTDATAPTYNGTLTGGGAVAIPAYCNGSAWVSH